MTENKENEVTATEQPAAAAATAEAPAEREREPRRGGRERSQTRDRNSRDRGDNQFLERVVTINRVSKSSRVVVASASPRSSSWAMATVSSASATARRAKSPRHLQGCRRGQAEFLPGAARRLQHPPPVQGEAAAGVVLLRPAAAGTGVIAGGPVRAVLECAGIHDVLSKSLGSSNTINIVHATVAALKQLEEPRAVAARRGLDFDQVAPARLVRAEADAVKAAKVGA